MEEKKMTSIGGQAVIEGVMMRGPHKTAVAVRKPDGEIIIDEKETKGIGIWSKVPIIRGCVSFISSMVIGSDYAYRVILEIIPSESYIVKPCTNYRTNNTHDNRIQKLIRVNAKVSGSFHTIKNRKHKARGNNDAVPLNLKGAYAEGGGVYEKLKS